MHLCAADLYSRITLFNSLYSFSLIHYDIGITVSVSTSVYQSRHMETCLCRESNAVCSNLKTKILCPLWLKLTVTQTYIIDILTSGLLCFMHVGDFGNASKCRYYKYCVMYEQVTLVIVTESVTNWSQWFHCIPTNWFEHSVHITSWCSSFSLYISRVILIYQKLCWLCWSAKLIFDLSSYLNAN